MTAGLAALLLALLAAGCGGGGGGGETLSKQEYQQRLTEAGTTVSESAQSFGDDLRKAVAGDADAADQAADEIHGFQDRLRSTADGLDDVQPPADAAEAHDQLVAGLRAYADDLDELHDALHDGKLEDLGGRIGDFASRPSLKQLDRAAKRLQELGYTFQ